MSETREQRIRRCLEEALDPVDLLIKDQSHLHAGHAGAKDGRGHFEVRIIADAFDGRNRIERHQLVYSALGDLLESDIHALRIKALAPSEQDS